MRHPHASAPRCGSPSAAGTWRAAQQRGGAAGTSAEREPFGRGTAASPDSPNCWKGMGAGWPGPCRRGSQAARHSSRAAQQGSWAAWIAAGQHSMPAGPHRVQEAQGGGQGVQEAVLCFDVRPHACKDRPGQPSTGRWGRAGETGDVIAASASALLVHHSVQTAAATTCRAAAASRLPRQRAVHMQPASQATSGGSSQHSRQQHSSGAGTCGLVRRLEVGCVWADKAGGVHSVGHRAALQENEGLMATWIRLWGGLATLGWWGLGPTPRPVSQPIARGYCLQATH